MILNAGQSGVADRRDADDRLRIDSHTDENFSIDLKDKVLDEKEESDHSISLTSVIHLI